MVEVAYKFFAVDGDTDTTIYEFTKERPDRFIFGYDHFMLETHFSRTSRVLRLATSLTSP